MKINDINGKFEAVSCEMLLLVICINDYKIMLFGIRYLDLSDLSALSIFWLWPFIFHSTFSELFLANTNFQISCISQKIVIVISLVWFEVSARVNFNS